MKIALCATGSIGCFILGTVAGVLYESKWLRPQAAAYLIASWDIQHADQLQPFSAAVIPLAKKAGLKILAASPQVEVLEGEWPYPGYVFVQEYTSMDALLKFWRSVEHAEVKKLREGHVNSHFVIAIDALR